jgi:hypothetical protein
MFTSNLPLLVILGYMPLIWQIACDFGTHFGQIQPARNFARKLLVISVQIHSADCL